ncbi:hypothetical protein PV04_07661 [Phialophora macrospora]|uniref:Uncharacterized protein n=1 Tax=Phialophora macrospora TaxID=1851006 RepID=A0A0D2FBK7_9EURO|nr:hypothetical protein PV04_07661 [Phialophora macrospora]
MSGVEAIIGLAAGGAGLVSLGIQLIESTTKLKRIYRAAQDAPTTLSRLTFDLETMAMALHQLDQRRQAGTPTEALLARCIIACRQSTGEVKELVDKLETCMARHTKFGGKLYTAFKQHDVRGLLDNLENAKSSLHFAYTMYLAEEQALRDRAHSNMLMVQSTMICDMKTQMMVRNASLSDQLTLVAQPSGGSQHQLGDPETRRTLASSLCGSAPSSEDEEGSLVLERTDTCNRPRKYASTKNAKSRFRVTLRLPDWICRRTYDIALLQLQCGWDVLLRTYNVVSYDSPIFRFIRNGDLAGIRRLIESGNATPLDVVQNVFSVGLLGSFGPWRTLLEEAAFFGNADISRYLLSQATWPDHDTVLSRALGVFSYWNCSGLEQDPSEMYRLFMAESDFDAAIDNGLRYGWLQFCNTAEILEAILQNQACKLDARPVQTRFEIASRLEATDAASFLKCIGLDSSDPKLASLRNSKGKTMIHVVAHHLRLYWELFDELFDECSQRIEGWLDLGVSVLKNGADPSSLAELEEPWLTCGEILETDTDPPARPPCKSPKGSYITPLLLVLNIDPNQDGFRFGVPEDKLSHLRLWAAIMQRAGLDLCRYGAGEYEIWKSFGVVDFSQNLGDGSHYQRMLELLYGATPEQWSFGVCHTWSISLYKLQQPPGAFPKQAVVPLTIAWLPTRMENDEGPWTLVEEKRHVTNDGDVEDLARYSPEPFNDLVDAYQDDAGVIMLMQHRASRGRCTRIRSHSQPPSLRQRERAYYAKQNSFAHPWLPCYHLCPGAPSWRFDCLGDDSSEVYQEISILGDSKPWPVFHVRSCVKGINSGRSSVQQSSLWQSWSFLADIVRCQNYAVYRGRGAYHMHDCLWPEVCRDFHVERLNVPEDLRDYHPWREYVSDDDDDGENGSSAGP